jgi:MOSC domain-containing protein YiiM
VLRRRIGSAIILVLLAGVAIWVTHAIFQREPLFSKDHTGILVMRMEGENFTTEGFLEDVVHIVDRLRVGPAEFVVSQPRMPCFKLGIRFGRPEIVKRFLRSGRTGVYLAVLQEGRVTAGDSMESLTRDEPWRYRGRDCKII